MASVNEKLFSIGVFKKLSSSEAECVLCSTDHNPKRFKTAKHSSSTLIKHLKKLPEQQKQFEELRYVRQQPTITKHVTGIHGGLTVLDRRVIALISCANLSFNVINHSAFKDLFALTNNTKEVLKDEEHYRDSVLPRVYMYVKARVKSYLDECSALSFTCDIWTGPTKNFISLTAHGISQKWERKRFILAIREFQGSHTGLRIKAMVDDLMHEWQIPNHKIHAVLHDQASSMITAFEQSDIEDADCAAHKINLTRVTIMLTSCRAIVSHFRHSHQASEKLELIQREKKLPEHHLIQDVETRWDATFLMINRLLEQKSAINAYCVEHKRDLLLSADDWELLKELRDLLEPFRELNKAVCRDWAPISMQIAVGHAIRAELMLQDGGPLRDEVRRMIKIYTEKFAGLEKYRTQAVAHILDPRFKDRIIADPDAAAQFRLYSRHCIGECVGVLDDPVPDVQDLTASPPPKKRSFMNAMRSKLLGSGPSSNNNASSSQPVPARRDYESEMDKYLREPIIEDWDEDPVIYWKANQERFPLLAPVARRFLSAPTTSVASEQLFSTAKIVFDHRRCRLSAQKAEMLVFLSRNLPIIQYRY